MSAPEGWVLRGATTVRSVAETRRLAAALVAAVPDGAVVALDGDLGAGKTTFVQAAIAALPGGADSRVQSPTYALAQTHPTTPVAHHLDLYRLEGEDAAFDLGLADLVEDPAALAFVEWPVRAVSLFPVERTLWLAFGLRAGRSRRVTVHTATAGAFAACQLERALDLRPPAARR